MIERSLGFGPGGILVGTVCLPEPSAARARTGMLLLNAGVVHRVGPHRINVRLARRLAARGIPSLRFDLAGQGDSARAAGGLPFEAQAIQDLRDAMDCLAREAGVEACSIFGFCSGGVHAYGAALRDPRIAGLLMYDTFHWRTARSRLNRYLLPMRQRGVAASVLGFARRLPASIARRLRGEHGPRANPVIGQFGTPTREEFASRVRDLHARGTRVAMVFSGNFIDYNYAGQFDDAFRGLGIDGLVEASYLPTLNHSGTLLAAQAELLDVVAGWATRVEAKR
jgi:hypothetical protein